jgi:hypothetical protein
MPSPRIYPSNRGSVAVSSRTSPRASPHVDAIATILEFMRQFRPRGRRFNQQRKLWLNETWASAGRRRYQPLAPMIAGASQARGKAGARCGSLVRRH